VYEPFHLYSLSPQRKLVEFHRINWLRYRKNVARTPEIRIYADYCRRFAEPFIMPALPPEADIWNRA
jgi:hypothetical protein